MSYKVSAVCAATIFATATAPSAPSAVEWFRLSLTVDLWAECIRAAAVDELRPAIDDGAHEREFQGMEEDCCAASSAYA